jgi:hypothetical protein
VIRVARRAITLVGLAWWLYVGLANRAAVEAALYVLIAIALARALARRVPDRLRTIGLLVLELMERRRPR